MTFVTNQTFSRWSQSWIFTLRNHLLRHFPEVMGISKYVTYWETSQLWHLLQIKHFLVEVSLEYSRWETIYWGIFLKSWVYLNMSLTEKPYNCDICYKSNIFSLKSILNIHAEKPFIVAFSLVHRYVSICYTLRNLTTVTFVTNQTFSRWSQSWIFTLRNHLLWHFP